MAGRSMYATPTLPRLPTVLETLRSRETLVPEFQRGFVWNEKQRLALLDSVFRGLPIGTLMVWGPRDRPDLSVKDCLGPVRLDPEPEDAPVPKFLLDGLQRVTTLYAALHPESPGECDSGDKIRWPIHFDLQPAEEGIRFSILRRGEKRMRTLFPMQDLFNDEAVFAFKDDLHKAGLGHLSAEVNRLVSAFTDYIIPMVPLNTDDIKEVTETFARVNMQGTTMAEVDMVRALTYRKGAFDLNRRLEEILSELEPLGWGGLRRQQLLNILKVVSDLPIYKTEPDDLVNNLQTSTHLGSIADWIAGAIQVLQRMGIWGGYSLPYVYQLAALTRAVQRHGVSRVDSQTEELRRWLFTTAYREDFKGMSNRALEDAFDLVEHIVLGDESWPPQGWDGYLVEPIRYVRRGAVRTTLFALCLAREGDKTTGDSKLARLFGRQGTLSRLDPNRGSEEPAGFVIAEPEVLGRLRDAMPPTLVQFAEESLLRQHLISEESLRALNEKGMDAFVSERQRELDQLERSFVEDLGLKWAPG